MRPLQVKLMQHQLTIPTSRYGAPRLPYKARPRFLPESNPQPLMPRIATRFSSTSLAIPLYFGHEIPAQASKRIPPMCTQDNEADILERSLQYSGFKYWGFAIYRCSYESDADWEEFLRRFLYHVPARLKLFNGLDLMGTFRPTVVEDPSFEGATAAKDEHGWTLEQGLRRLPCRYRWNIQVTPAALESVLKAPAPWDPEDIRYEIERELGDETAYVRIVNSQWNPEERNGPQERDESPIEGCTLAEIGWYNLLYDQAQFPDFWLLHDLVIDDYYERPPAIMDASSSMLARGRTKDGEGETNES